MSLVSGVMVYIVVWWTVLFAVLPVGVKTPDNPTKGFASSAPENPNLRKKFLATSGISAIIWMIIEIIMINHWVRFT